MKYFIPLLLLVLAIMAGCHKNDVDVGDLNTNPFDRDHPGEYDFFTVDSIQTEAYAQGLYYKQTAVVHVHPEQFPVPIGYTLVFIELTDPDTSYFYSYNEAGSNTFPCVNYQVALGTEYCYRFELWTGDMTEPGKERCAVAQL
jgi:hypothetical protein